MNFFCHGVGQEGWFGRYCVRVCCLWRWTSCSGQRGKELNEAGDAEGEYSYSIDRIHSRRRFINEGLHVEGTEK